MATWCCSPAREADGPTHDAAYEKKATADIAAVASLFNFAAVQLAARFRAA
jgi:hypothetical protein